MVQVQFGLGIESGSSSGLSRSSLCLNQWKLPIYRFRLEFMSLIQGQNWVLQNSGQTWPIGNIRNIRYGILNISPTTNNTSIGKNRYISETVFIDFQFVLNILIKWLKPFSLPLSLIITWALIKDSNVWCVELN